MNSTLQNLLDELFAVSSRLQRADTPERRHMFLKHFRELLERADQLLAQELSKSGAEARQIRQQIEQRLPRDVNAEVAQEASANLPREPEDDPPSNM